MDNEVKDYFIYHTFNAPNGGLHRGKRKLCEGDILVAVVKDNEEAVAALVAKLNKVNNSHFLGKDVEDMYLANGTSFISKVTVGLWYDYFRYCEAQFPSAEELMCECPDPKQLLSSSLVTYSSSGDLQ